MGSPRGRVYRGLWVQERCISPAAVKAFRGARRAVVTVEVEKMGGLFRVTKVSQLHVARGAARAAFVYAQVERRTRQSTLLTV